MSVAAFKNRNNFKQRSATVTQLMEKYEGMLPIIILPATKSTPKLEKYKFLIPRTMTLSRLMNEIRARLDLDINQALFIFFNDVIYNPNMLMETIYNKKKDQDGFLYLQYSLENTFG